MKKYRSIKIKRYQSLFEGKKQAIQMLQKHYGRDAKKIVNELEKLDPTSPKNKYLEVFAKLFLDLYKNSRDSIDQDIEKFFDTFNSNKIFSKIKELEKKSQRIDLSKIKNFKDFLNTVEKASSKITKGAAKQGIKGIKEGKDYITVLENKQLASYIPLNYGASKVIASNRVGKCEGDWCTAYQKTDKYWEDYVIDGEGVLVYTIIFDEDITENYEDLKHAIYFYNDKKTYEIFDTEDDPVSKTFQFSKIQSFVYKNWDKIREHFPKPKHWIKKADISSNADFDVLSSRKIIWINGTWKDGTWQDGTWEKGTWKDGTWQDGTWLDGNWEKGTWQDGTWHDGKIWSDTYKTFIDSFTNPNEFYKFEDQSSSVEELKELVY